MKKGVYWLAISGFLMLLLPWLTVTFITNDARMITTILLFLVVNPAYSIIAGVFAGKNIQDFWWLPVISALLFLTGAWMFLEAGELSFIAYAFVYGVLGIAAMLISAIL